MKAGFTKIHLDTSMGCAGESVALPDARHGRARRRSRGRRRGGRRSDAFEPPVYVIGTEVPVPGGALEALDHLQVTSPEAALETVEIHRRAFAGRNLQSAFERAIAVVVQPGVEFGNEDVFVYRADEGPGAERRAALDAAVRFRGAFDRLSAAGGPWRRLSRMDSPS